jgi:glutathione-independent formaldehyde dehydrogenase
MTTNRGVVYVGPGKVEVKGIDYPKFVVPNGKEIDHGVILRIVSTGKRNRDQARRRAKRLRRLRQAYRKEICA